MTTLVVTDLDGTLWDNTLTCHPDTLAAIAELQARDDVELLTATGRRRNSARRGFKANGISMPAVLLNGAIGFDFTTEQLFHEMNFTPQDLDRVLQVLAANNVAPVAYLSDTTAVAVEGVTTSAHHLSTLGEDLVWWTMDQLAARSDVLGLSMLGIPRADVAAAFDLLVDDPAAETNGFTDELYPPFSMMIAPKGIDKQRGIEAWCAHKGLTPDRVIALGDAGNDIAMLTAADVAVTVAGAADDVRALGHHEIRPPAEGGWATILDLI